MADNTTYTKANFKSIVADGKGGDAIKEREGYEFTAYAIDGKLYKMNVFHDEDGKWRVVDPMTGKSVGVGDTRAKAVEAATTPESVRNFANMVKLDKYTAMVDRFIELCGGKKAEPKPAPKTSKPKAELPKAPAKQKAEKPKAPKKAAPKKDKELAEARKEIEQLRKELAELKAEKVEQVTTPVEVITLETMRKWCEGKGLEAKQIHPGSQDNIWILGPSKPYQEELTSMGFRWARRSKVGQGWYAKPTA